MSPEDIARLGLDIETDGLRRGERELDDFTDGMRRAERQSESMEKSIKGLVGALAGLVAGAQILEWGEAWKRAENQIKTVSDSMAEVRSAQDGLFKASQDTYSSYEATAKLFVAIERSAKGFLKDQQDTLGVVENVNKALAVGGAGRSEQQSALQQLGQGLASGRLQGDEFRSIAENAPLIADAVAKFGFAAEVSRGQLRKLSEEGKITSDVVVKALKEMGPALDAAFKNLDPTIGQALTKLDNAFIKLTGTRGSTLFNAIADGISWTADNLEELADAALIAAPAMLAIASPQIVAGIVAIGRAFQALTLQMVKNPIGAIAVALTTAAVAFYTFSDEMTVATREVQANNELLAGSFIKFNVTVQDVMNEIPGAIWDATKEAGSAIGAFIAESFGATNEQQIKAFWTEAVDVTKDALNRVIGFFVGGWETTFKFFTNIPKLAKESGIVTANFFLQGIELLVNGTLGALNGLGNEIEKALSLAGIKLEIPDFKPVAMQIKNDFAGTWDEVLKPFGDGVSGKTDYLGDIGKDLKARAIKSRQAKEEALELQRRAAGDGTGYGGGVISGDEKGDKSAAKLLERIQRQSDALALSLNNAKEELDQFLSGGERGQALAKMTGDLMSKYKDLFSAKNFGSGDAARKAAEDYAKQFIAIADAAKRAKIAADDLFNAESSTRLNTARTTGDVADPISGQVENYRDLNEAAFRQQVIEEAIRDARKDGLEVQEKDIIAAKARLDVSTAQYIAAQKQLAVTQQEQNELLRNAVKAGTVTYGNTRAQAKDAAEAVRLQSLALQEQQKALSQGVILTDAQLATQVKQVDVLNAQNDQIDRMVSRVQQLDFRNVEAGFQDSITGAFDNFFSDIVKNKGSALSNLRSAFTDMFKEAEIIGLKAGFEPFLLTFRTQLAAAFTQAAKSASATISKAVDEFANPRRKTTYYKTDKNGDRVIDREEMPNADTTIGKISDKLSKVFGGLINAIKGVLKGPQGAEGFSFSGVLAGYSYGQGIASLAQSFGIGGKDKVQQQNSQIGSAIGAVIGSFLPGIGTAIGAAIGGVLGGLFGKESNYTAGINYEASGVSQGGVYGTKRTPETTQALQGVMDALKNVNTTITTLGGTTSLFVKQLEIGGRDPGYAAFSDGRSIKTAVADPTALANAAGLELLKASTFANKALNSLKDGMVAAGSSFDEISEAMQTVNAVLKASDTPLSAVEQALKTIRDTFNPLIEKTKNYAQANKDLTDAMNGAIKAVADQVNQANKDILLSIVDPVAFQYQKLLKDQAQAMKDATAAGADLNLVYQLNAAKTKDFIDGLANGAANFDDLKKAYESLKAAMQSTGQDTAQLTAAFEKSRGEFRKEFDDGVTDAILQNQNQTLYDLKKLLDQQKERLASAVPVGGNVVAAERLNAIQIGKFFAGLSEEQKLSLGDYLGIIEDYTGKIGVVLTQLGDALTTSVDNMKETLDGLRDTASTYNALAKSLRDTQKSIQDQYGNVSPMARLTDMRASFRDTVDKAQAGDKEAAEALPDLANKLIERSRDLFSSSAAFYQDFALVTQGLQRAGVGTQEVADAATRQADALETQIDLLTEIKAALQDSNPNLAFLANASGQIVDGNAAIRGLLDQYLTLEAAQANASLSDTQLQNLASAVASGVTAVITTAPVANDVQIDATTRNTAAVAALQAQVGELTIGQNGTNTLLNQILKELRKQTRSDQGIAA